METGTRSTYTRLSDAAQDKTQQLSRNNDNRCSRQNEMSCSGQPLGRKSVRHTDLDNPETNWIRCRECNWVNSRDYASLVILRLRKIISSGSLAWSGAARDTRLITSSTPNDAKPIFSRTTEQCER